MALVACNGTSAPAPSEAPPPVSTTTVKPAIAWPAAGAIDAHALDALGDGRTPIARSPVPVLAPSADLHLEAPTVVVEGEYYAISAHAPGVSIHVQGTRVAHRYEHIAPNPGNRPIRGGRGFVTVNEGIRSVSFVENGAAYTVDVECASFQDARCADDRFVVEVADGLAYVGGAGR